MGLPVQLSDKARKRIHPERPVIRVDVSVYIYFIQAGCTGPIKIGRSHDPYRRLDGLQTANPEKLSLLAAFPVDDKINESSLHCTFDHLRIRGEWFKPTNDLLNFIRTNLDCNDRALRSVPYVPEFLKTAA